VSSPLVSVLIPCFNSARFIGETLESVFRQSWPAIEVVVVNDGSTDASLQEIRRFARPGLVVIDRENRGAAASRNEAFARSSGAFVQFLDADDLISPDKIMLQMHRLLSSADCIASAEWGRFRSDPQETIFLREPVWQDLDPLDWLAASRVDGLGTLFPALWLIPRAVATVAGPWLPDLTVGDDTEYFTRLILASKRILFCNEARAFYRSGIAGSLSGDKSLAGWASQFKANELCEEMVLAREDSDRMRRGFSLTWQSFAHSAYPYDRDLAKRALAHGHALHPVRTRPGGGPTFHLVSRFVGWRLARLLQVASGRP
jgi:glycosyltransferase involved in cell wall biosynthesis